MAKFDNNFLAFSLDKDHIYEIGGELFGFAYKSNGTVTFHMLDEPRKTVSYDFGVLNRLNACGKIEVRPYAQLPKELRPVEANTLDDVFMSCVPEAKRKRADAREAMVMSYQNLKAQNLFKVTDDEINRVMSEIRDGAEAYLFDKLPNPEYFEKLSAYQRGEGVKPRARSLVELPAKVSASTLRKWESAYNKGGKKALLDRLDKRGNHFSYFSLDEMTLLARVVDKEFMSRQRKSIATVHADVKAAFKKENQRRAHEGEPNLRTPGRDALSGFIKRLDKFHVMVARFGQQEALKKMRPVNKGLETLRPFERVEMDEWKIDLLTFMVKSDLMELFSPEDRERMRLDGAARRWWMVAAIDCRTNCLVGLSLTPNPKTSGAIKCLRMVVSDKERFAEKIGALAPWPMAGTPETLYVDNGSAFKSTRFTNVCADLGINKIQTIAGRPSMRGKIERIFGTFSGKFLPRLSGRTFGSVSQRGAYASEEFACHTVEDLIYALVRWIADVYHITPQISLGGRTPLEQWEQDLADGNYPLMSMPSIRRKRIAFGLPYKRVVQKDGITVLNVQYQSGDLAAWFLKQGNRELNVRWFEENIGAIEVEFDGVWQEVPAVRETFEGVDASTWLATRRALRSRDPKRLEWEEHIVSQAIADIEALNAERKAARKIIDHGWDEKRLKAAENEAMSSFKVVEQREASALATDGFGRSVVPVEQIKPALIRETNADQVPASAATWDFED